MKTTVGKTKKQRTKDNTMAMFPAMARKIERSKRVVKALKAVRKALRVDGPTWPAEDVATLIEALKEQVQPPPASAAAEPVTVTWPNPVGDNE
jgi:hypothetical protein